MSERLPEGHTISNAGSVVGCATNFQNQQASETDSPSARTLEAGSIGNSINQIPNGTKTQTGKPEWVVQDEPGVYLTLSAIPGGGNELKRVRFRYVFPPFFITKYKHINPTHIKGSFVWIQNHTTGS